MSKDASQDIEALKRQLLLRRLNATATSVARAPAIEPADRSGPLPISWAQQRLWFLDQLDPEAATAYHIPTALRLTGQLNHTALRAALNRIVARHEALRTTFASVDGEVVQRIAPGEIGFALRERDVSALPADQQETEVERIGAAEFSHPFDLAADPLIRGQLLRLSDDQHVLLVTQHHIISDGWSIGILVKEFSTLYAAFCQGLDDPLPALAIQTADYAAWQRGWLQGAVLQAQLDYWKQHLSGAPPLLDLPLDRPRPALQSHAGGTHEFVLTRALSDGLRQLGAEHGATLFMTLLAGWSAFLSRISGERDIVVGTAVANRQRAEIAPLIGFFVNTLALRTRLDDDPTVAALLARTKTAALGAFAHQDVPFDQIVDVVRPLRNLSHSPLFQVMLSLNNTPRDGDLSLPGLRVTPVHSGTVKTHFDLTLALNDSGAELSGCIEYASDLFDAQTIARMAAHLCTFLGAMVADSTQAVSKLALLDDRQRQQLVVGFNAEANDGPDPDPQRLFQHLLEQHARAQPDALALMFGQQALSYAQLNRRVNALAHRLIARGIAPGQRVAICIERSIDMIIAVLGVLKAGAAYVPFDPNNPNDRLAYMWQDSTPVALLTSSVLGERMQALIAGTPGAALLLLDAPGLDDGGDDSDPVVPGLDAECAAYVIYTSGSTGLPKGVVIAHRGLVNLVEVQRRRFVLTPASRVLQFSSFVFDASVWEMVMAFAHGASLHMGSMEALYPGAPLATMLRTHGITHASLPSSALAVMSVSELSARLTLIVAGDAFAASLANQWAGAHNLFNGYGPTETTVCATLFPCQPNHEGPLPIGRPLPSRRLYVLDQALQPVPIGVTGELYIGGIAVALGYLNRPELTAERFIADPFDTRPQARLYRTGDLGRWRSDGNLEFMGRTDFQVKIRGFRVELGEIEARLRACDNVSEATVIAREDDGNKRLVAYIVMQEGTQLDAAAMRGDLALNLAEHMLPSAFVAMDRLPLTANGKVDHRALPAPDRSALPVREYTAPEGPMETVLAQIWQDLLGLERVGRFDNFFEIGGHSLLAVQVVAALRRQCEVDVALRDVFQYATVAALAEVVALAGRSDMPAMVAVDRSASLPCSFAQQRLWFLDQLDHAAGAAYHIPMVLRLTGELDAPALRATLDRIVARHEILRTAFVAEDGKPVQRIAAADVGIGWRERDLSALGEAARARAVTDICEREAVAPFTLSAAPLIRAQLLRLAEHDFVLLVTQHHIISDAWSLAILVREVEALYPALAAGQLDPLPALSLQYADYSAWQHSWLHGEQLQAQIQFWKDKLAGAPGLLTLPTDHPRPQRQSYVGGAVALTLAPGLVAGLRRLSQRQGTTMFMTLMAGWAILLSRLSGQHDLVIGTPVANRPRAELEGMIGFFVNTLALRIDVDASASVSALLQQIKANALAAYAHQELPFEQVVEALQPARSLAHAPLFQVMLALNNIALGEAISLPGVTLSAVEQPRRHAQFDLTLSLGEAGDLIDGRLEYASDLFEHDTIERMVGALQLLLAGMVADDSQRIASLSMMTAAERQQLVVGFNQSATPAPGTWLIHQLIEAQALAQPEAQALEQQGASLSYGELNRRANQLAHYLRSMGIQAEDRVALCLERGSDMIIGMLGVLKAGGAYVPLDPGYPAERLALMLNDSAPMALLTQSSLKGNWTAMNFLRTVVLDDMAQGGDGAAIARLPEANPDLAVAADGSALAYIIYTSGSSGVPKGVMIEHRNVVNLVSGNTFAPLERDDCLAHCASPAFDAATWEIWGALAAGARICIVSQAQLLDPKRFAAALVAGRVSALWLTVGLFNEYAGQIGAALAGLRHLLVGGDALDPRSIGRLLGSAERPRRVVNGYGPTETTTFAITHDIAAVAAGARSIPIGRPIANAQVYILDGDLQPVALGVAGEIYIGGRGVGRGYWNRPALTAERFVADPFRPASGARLYRTGDLGRWCADGAIEFLGRNDFQVKIRGFRIEPGEIEARLAACAGVREALVLAREDQPGSKRLVAYLSAQAGASVSVAALRAQLAEVLADYMLPGAYVVLDAFPLTPNGKVDRKALPAPDQSAVATQAYEAPAGAAEIAIAAIWQALLGVERVGRHDHFFDMGGHSLLAVQLVSRIRQQLGVELSLRDLFSHPSLSGLAQVVLSCDAAGPAAIMAADRSQPLPLSWAQQRLWFLDQLDHAAGAAYHMPAALRLSGALDKHALQGALDAVVARHEVLRTSFPSAGDVAVQQIAPADTGLALASHDLRAVADQQAALARRAQDEASAPFDLASGPLIRGQLLQLADDEHILLLTQHHIISDGWSIGILVREVSTLYAAFSQGLANPLPPLAIQYADFAAWQRAWLQGEALEQQLDFWTAQLAGAPALLELPTDRARPAVQSYAGARVQLELDATLTAGLRALSQRHGATLFMSLLAAWSVLLARLSGQQDLVIGTPVANRQRGEIEALIGFFVNTLALRVRLDNEMTVTELLAQIKADTLAAYAHQDLPFEQVVEALKPPRSMGHSPVFQVMLSLNNTPDDGALHLPGLTLSSMEMAHATTHFDLTLSMSEHDDKIVGSLEYASDLFDRASMERLLANFRTVVGAMLADEQQQVHRLAVLDAHEQTRLLHEFNASRAQLPGEHTIQQLFEAQVQAAPDAIALQFGDSQLSYGDLNRRANHVAHALLAHGVGPDDLVALCLERSIGMVVAMLGVIKAGAAYLPVDPSYPAERQSSMLEDSCPAVLITAEAVRERLPHHGVPVLLLDQSGHDSNPRVDACHARSLAYVIYTSGSTGQPKGVMVEHRSVVRLVKGADYIALDAGSVVAQASNASFDAATFEIWGALLNGGKLVYVDKDCLLTPTQLSAQLQRDGINVLFVTTALFNRVAQEAPDAFAGLKALLFGGEAVSLAAVRAIAQAGKPAHLLHVYGPTENTTFSTWFDVEAGALERASTVPIGASLGASTLFVLDAARQLLPIGAVGELYIGGPGLARGYLGQPALTQERFVPNPFARAAGERLYRTGDLVRWNGAGQIEYVGRNDFQVKIRGFRIEPGEIEASLRRCDQVRDAIVTASTSAGGEKRLTAYVVACEGAQLAVGDLRRQLALSLADYMIPSAFVLMPSLPLNANGKVDRAALPAPDMAAMSTRHYEAPLEGAEQALALIWQSLLNVDRVGRHDHFFELGGHSLLAIQLRSALRQQCKVEIAVRDVFTHPVLSELAAAVTLAQPARLTAIGVADRSAALRLSWAQQRLWFLDQLDHAAGAAYHMPAGLRLDGVLDKAALRATLDRLVARHEILRTSFVLADGQAQQAIAPAEIGFALSERDLSHLGGHERELAVKLLSVECATAPFDLATGPLIRGLLLCLSAHQHVLLINQHHIISDGWSLGILVREVSALYSAFCQGQPDPLPPLAIQYADYAAWQRSWLQGALLQQQLDYWKTHLAGAPALLELPTDHARPAVQSYAGANLPVVLDAGLTAKLRALSQRHGATLFMTLLGAWSVLLARLSGQQDVVIGTPVANRQRSEVESLLGFFVNTMALRVRLEDDPTVAQLLARIKADTLRAYEHQDLPFEQVVEALNPVRGMGHSAVFQAMLTLNNTPDGGELSLPGLTLNSVAQTHVTTHFDVTLALSESGDQLSGALTYASDLFEPARMQRLLLQLKQVLQAMVEDDGQAVSALSLLDAAQRAQLLLAFNDTAMDFPDALTLPDLFERQVRAQPDAIAVVAGADSLSYAELNRRANRVAHRLLAMGIEPDDRIALCVERGVDMMAGLLGIWKAGAAYVPMEPANPRERLMFMLADCAPVALLTQAALAPEFADLALPVLCVDAAGLPAEAEHNPVRPDLHVTHLAYVIYTSGSTGAAKGVMVEHRSAVNFWSVMCHSTHAHCAAPSRIALNASFAFDMSLKGILQLLSGHAVFVIPQQIRADGPRFLQFLVDHGIHAFDCTPSQLDILLNAGLLQLPQHQIRSVLIGGEAIGQAMWHALRACDAIGFFNMYGPTECTVDATLGPIAGEGPRPHIGTPLGNAHIYILDARRQPVPLGVIGEIYIGGAGLARGYLHRPELTAERFVAHPFSADPQARLYRSGDLGCWMDDGKVCYMGRNDSQVKIRGFRVELGEIESALRACSGVGKEASVVVQQLASGEQRLLAYYVAQADAAPTASALRYDMAALLPEHMIPAAFVRLDALPLTPNGKLDQRALPAPDAASVVLRSYVAPQGHVETVLAHAWQSLLQVEAVGRDDHFFELGGHSLLAVQLVARIARELGVQVALRELFSHPTLQQFARAVQARQGAAGHANLVRLRPQGTALPLFLVHPGEGEVDYARRLLPSIAQDIPVYALSALGFMPGETPLYSVPEMAAHYIASLRQVQPQGPYRVAGWSAGGTIAFEMACQLLAAGEALDFVGLIDTVSDYPPLDLPSFDLAAALQQWLPAQMDGAARAAVEAALAGKDVDAALMLCVAAAVAPPLDLETLRRHLAVRHAIAIATRTYVRPQVALPICLLTAIDARRSDPTLGWRQAAPSTLQWTPIGGDHYSIMESPHIERVGATISTTLEASMHTER